METLSFKLPPTLLKALEERCRELGISKSEFVRTALERNLSKLESKKKPSCYDLIEDLIGFAKDAPRDLATNPKYMEDYGR
jgi:metal-responsive CopG/Arc/MetJ family transcriptional regulator